MPTYVCQAAAGRLGPDARARIARALTQAHHEATGAPTSFARVLFQPWEEGACFIGGVPLAHDHVFLHGTIRAGRTPEQRRDLVDRLTRALATASGVEARGIWVYVVEAPATQMVEFGQVLPEAGGEAAWRASLPPELAAFLDDLERRARPPRS